MVVFIVDWCIQDKILILSPFLAAQKLQKTLFYMIQVNINLVFNNVWIFILILKVYTLRTSNGENYFKLAFGVKITTVHKKNDKWKTAWTRYELAQMYD